MKHDDGYPGQTSVSFTSQGHSEKRAKLISPNLATETPCCETPFARVCGSSERRLWHSMCEIDVQPIPKMTSVHAQSPFNELQELEFASELLELQSEDELNNFLGGLLAKAAPHVTGFFRSPAGKTVGGLLKGAVKRTLPVAGRTPGGSAVPNMGVGTGGDIAAGIGSLLGFEAEGLSAEDREFETAKQLVRLGGAAAALAASNPSDATAGRRAAVEAARAFAPGLIGKSGCKCHGDQGCACKSPKAAPQSGTWERRGGQVILSGF